MMVIYCPNCKKALRKDVYPLWAEYVHLGTGQTECEKENEGD